MGYWYYELSSGIVHVSRIGGNTIYAILGFGWWEAIFDIWFVGWMIGCYMEDRHYLS